MGQLVSPETSERTSHYSLRNNSEYRCSQIWYPAHAIRCCYYSLNPKYGHVGESRNAEKFLLRKSRKFASYKTQMQNLEQNKGEYWKVGCENESG